MLSKPTAKGDEGRSVGENHTPGRDEGAHKTWREWLGLRELTQYANLSERTIRTWIYSPIDPLPAAKVCGKVLVRRADFDSYLQRHRVKPLEEINIDGIVQDVMKGATDGS